jgi:L-ascorbate metabolism protein UlaG (beta-lactamase superfamily)
MGEHGETVFPKHFDGRRFYNPNARQALSFGAVFKWKTRTRPEKSPRFVNDVTQTAPPQEVEGDELRVTLVNHSTVLLQARGVNILTDPVWSERISPVSWIGPRRHRAPGVRIEDLPRIDAVLISHNHYDHLDLPTLRRLAARGPAPYVVPLGVAELVRSQKIATVHELDWGQSVPFENFIVRCVPAQHFSARGIRDRNQSLWCGYVIETRARRVYFAGDTGFGPHFAQIREVFGPPDVALLPIGAYEPRWFMGPIHMAPDEAVEAHKILGARTSIAIHHGTFQLADDAIDTPPKQLAAAGAPKSFLVLKNGEFAVV